METNSPDQLAQSSARQQYTTVGSVWHPQSQPMQPPTRRGRTLRAAAPESYEYNSPTSPSYSTHYYSPLQQNIDRAVSPITPDRLLLERFAQLERKNNSDHSVIMPPAPGLPTVPYPPGDAYATPGNRSDANTYHSDGHGDSGTMNEEEMDNTLNQMSTKTLTNLASYSNPMQKKAQNILTRARQAPPSMHRESSDFTQENRGLALPPGFGARNARSDPVGMQNLLQSDGIDEYNFQQQQQPPQHFGPTNPNTGYARDSDTYPAVLSKGPGAPLPLTAGPPGQRQFQPSAFNPPANTMQRSFENPRGFEPFDNGVPRPHPHPSFASFESQQHMQSFPQQPAPAYQSQGIPPTHPVFPPPTINKGKMKENTSSLKIVDTLTAEEARKWFPNGLPANFNHDTKSIPDNWIDLRLKEIEEEKRMKREQTLMQQTPEVQAAHMAKVRSEFYAGNNMINKNLTMAMNEHNNRNVPPTMDSMFKGSYPSRDKVVNRRIPVDEANAISTPEHAAPPMSMMYQSLSKHSDKSPETGNPNNGGDGFPKRQDGQI